MGRHKNRFVLQGFLAGFVFLAIVFCFKAYAEEITIAFTGDTHGMIYPCFCPIQSDGGITRRATFLKGLRKQHPEMLLLDSGGFFAGGVLDDYTQSIDLDKTRTRINLSAMEAMKYDAVAIGDDEFNFGKAFLEESSRNTKIPFLTCNVSEASQNKTQQPDLFKPYLIKQIKGIKIGIVGVTSMMGQNKGTGLLFIEPEVAVNKAVKELKAQGVALVILLSHLGEIEDIRLASAIPEIDIIITGHSRSRESAIYNKIGSTLLLRPAWQARKVGIAILTLKAKKIIDYKISEERMSDQLLDDPAVQAFLPRCFSNNNCKKEGLIGICEAPGTIKSSCIFTEAAKIPLTVITSKDCSVCNAEKVLTPLKKLFPGLNVAYLYYPGAKAAKLVKDFAVEGLPAFFLGVEIEKEKSFSALSERLEKKGDLYMLKPGFSGYGYFHNRQRIKGKLDIFLSLYDKSAKETLEAIKDFKPTLHFLAVEKNGALDALKGDIEVEEYLRGVCVQKIYPQLFWSYVSCRAKNSTTSWWEDCLGTQDASKIRNCAKGQEGQELLRQNISLNRELKIMLGPTYLMDNQEIFGLSGVPTKEELKKILNKQYETRGAK